MIVTFGLWALLLMSQSFANTLVSRARNSSSLAYHSVASLLSNGIWFVSLFILVDSITTAIRTASVTYAILLGGFYTTFTLTGSVLSHWICMRWLETGKRAIGGSCVTSGGACVAALGSPLAARQDARQGTA